MLRLPLGLLLALGLFAPGAFSRSAAIAAPRDAYSRTAADAIDRLSSFARQLANSRREVTTHRGEAFGELFAEAERLSLSQPARLEELHQALILCAGLGEEPLNPVAQKAVDALEHILLLDRGTTFERWLTTVLSGSQSTALERRGAVRVLGPRRPARAIAGIITAARAADLPLQRTATRFLVGWSHPEVHKFFLGSLKEAQPTLEQLTRHLDLVAGSIDPQSQRALSATLFTLASQPGWRGAARATKLVSHLEPDAAVPFLIEALGLWVARGESGTGSRRIVYEIVDHLREISGRSIGAKPQAWGLWWKRVREGTIALASDEVNNGGGLSRPAFFGLQPVSDRVLFVLDRSGSMKAPFSYGDKSSSVMSTRYETAVAQVMSYLESSGPSTRFGLVLFSSDSVRWKRKLVEAKPQTLKQARKWLFARAPKGGTFLRTGVEAAVGVSRRGELDLKHLEADTIIVLCDGATQGGSGWVQEWVKRYNWEAQLVFHSVQIGSSGDGTLEKLASSTGGDMVRVK